MKNGHVEVFRWLSEQEGALAATSELSSKKENLVIIAAKHNQLEMLKYLLECGRFEWELDAKSEGGLTALMKAALNKHFEVAGYLKERGANVSAEMVPKFDLCVLAYEKKNLPLLEWLIEQRPSQTNINEVYSLGLEEALAQVQ